MKSKHVHRIKGRFWSFVQSFWQPHGGTDMCDEWHASGGWYADLRPHYKTRSFPKVLFRYHLELSSRYYLSVQLILSSYQKETLDSRIKVTSKLEAIRWALKVIKQFENSPNTMKEIWQKLLERTPIVKETLQGPVWIATCIVDSGSSSIYKSSFWDCHESNLPMGTGKFYYLSTFRNKWCWHTMEVSWCSYCESGYKSIPLSVWQSIKGFDSSLDLIINEAEELNKQDPNKAQQFLDTFYESQTEKEIMLKTIRIR